MKGGRKSRRETSTRGCLSSSPTGDLARNRGMCLDWELKQWLFGSQAGVQSTEPHQPGQHSDLLVPAQSLLLGSRLMFPTFYWISLLRCSLKNNFKSAHHIFSNLFTPGHLDSFTTPWSHPPSQVLLKVLILLEYPSCPCTLVSPYSFISYLDTYPIVLNISLPSVMPSSVFHHNAMWQVFPKCKSDQVTSYCLWLHCSI